MLQSVHAYMVTDNRFRKPRPWNDSCQEWSSGGGSRWSASGEEPELGDLSIEDVLNEVETAVKIAEADVE